MQTVTHFFLGANSGRGFQNLFQRFCEPTHHHDLIILKGGPGCGKSTLMNKIGEAMEGCGESVEYFHCSGDPDSLDGVHIPRIHAAVVDGTAPHTLEPRYPMAAERCVNLGEFCDITAVKDCREEIVHYTDTCSQAYRRAYRAMSAASQMADSAAALAESGLDREKLMRRTAGIISREIRGRGSGSREEYRFLGSQTWKGGVWRFDSVAKLCPKVYQLQDSFGFAAPMLTQIRTAAADHGYHTVVCFDPEHMEQPQHLLIPELELAFITGRDDMPASGQVYRRIRVDAMVNAESGKSRKARLRFTGRMTRELLEEATDALGEAKAAHDILESLYAPHVDFDGINALTEREIQRFESYL